MVGHIYIVCVETNTILFTFFVFEIFDDFFRGLGGDNHNTVKLLKVGKHGTYIT